MENIHLISTNKPSRLIIYSTLLNELRLLKEPITDWKHKRNICITNSEEIKEGDWVIIDYTFSKQGLMLVKTTEINLCDVEHGQQLAFSSNGCFHELRFCKKIILTTDVDLIADGVQAINDEFLEWFVKNPSCGNVEIETDYLLWKNSKKEKLSDCYKIIIPQEEPKQEKIEEAAEKYAILEDAGEGNDDNIRMYSYDFIAGAKSDAARDYWFKIFQQEQDKNKYSEEDIRLAINKARDISDGKNCFDAEDISGCNEVCTYGWKFNMSEDSIIEQFNKK
jgi:hypothetical protein